MTAVVIDASAGAEIVADTRRGRALARLMPPEAEGWVPEHFYAEVLSVIRRQTLITKTMSEPRGTAAFARLRSWHLHRASVVALIDSAWAYRHNMTAADGIYIALVEHLQAEFLSDDHNLIEAPTFPSHIQVLRIGARS